MTTLLLVIIGSVVVLIIMAVIGLNCLRANDGSKGLRVRVSALPPRIDLEIGASVRPQQRVNNSREAES